MLHGSERARIKPTRETRGLLETGWQKHKEKIKKIDGGNSAAGRCENTAEFGGGVRDSGAAARACASAGAAATDTLHNGVTVAATC